MFSKHAILFLPTLVLLALAPQLAMAQNALVETVSSPEYVEACRADDANACLRVGHMISASDQEGAAIEAFNWYQKGCELDDAEACFEAGYLIRFDKLVAGSMSDVRAMFSKACDLEHYTACAYLSDMLWTGHGGNADLDKATEVAKLACDHDDMLGCYTLGRRYDGGFDDEKRALAPELYKRACQQGEIFDACFVYGLKLGIGSREAVELGTSYFEVACEGGVYQGCELAGIHYVLSGSDAARISKGVTLLDKACMQGGVSEHDTACMKLWEMYGTGNGVVKNASKALTYLERGCETVEFDACLTLGNLALKSDDLDKAIAHLNRGCDAFSRAACNAVFALRDDERLTTEAHAALKETLTGRCKGYMKPDYCTALLAEETPEAD